MDLSRAAALVPDGVSNQSKKIELAIFLEIRCREAIARFEAF